MVDLVDKIEEVIRLHPVQGHQTAHRGAVALVIVLLNAECLLVGDVEIARDVLANPVMEDYRVEILD